jgi:hypothetical protein
MATSGMESIPPLEDVMSSCVSLSVAKVTISFLALGQHFYPLAKKKRTHKLTYSNFTLISLNDRYGVG